MRSGALDRKIVIQERTLSDDPTGESLSTFTDFATTWAELKPMASRDRFIAQAEHAVRSAVFRTRWIEGLDETMQIQYAGDNYQITGIAEIGRREGWEITAEAAH